MKKSMAHIFVDIYGFLRINTIDFSKLIDVSEVNVGF